MPCRLAFVAILLLSLPAVGLPQGAKRWPVPGKEAQAKIEALVQELFKDDLAKAEKDTAARSRLAQTLLFEGKETKDDSAGRYVLFFKAHTLAAQAGDVNTALQAADELAQDFNIPAGAIFKMKIQMLRQASHADGAPREAYQAVIDRSGVLLDDTLESDDFPSSLELIDAAEHAARKLRSIPLVASIRKKGEEVARQQKEFARWQPFAQKLAISPSDGKASLEMGKYFALIKGNWDRGAPLLAQGGEGELQALARDDLASAPAGKGAIALANRWHDLALNLDPSMKTHALLRASHWYQMSLQLADANGAAAVEQKLKAISELLPPEYRIGEIAGELKKVDVPSGPVYGCALSPDTKRFLVAGYDGALHLFNTKTGKEIRQLDGHVGKVWTVAFANDGRHAVSGGFDGSVRLWELTAGRELRPFEGHKDYVRSVAISADGQWILSGGDDRMVRLWNLQNDKAARVFPGHDHSVWSVALSSDGRRALSGSLDKTIRLWDTQTGDQLRRLTGHKDTVLCVAFSPDGRHAVSGSTDKTIRLWDLESGATIRIFEGTGGYVQSLAISPDGRRILSGGRDNVLRLWDTVTGQELRKLEGHRDQVWHIDFSQDGRLGISSAQDGTVRVWGGSR